MTGEVTAHVVVEDPGMSGHGHVTVLSLVWHPDDPLAVRLSLAAQPDHPALPRGDWSMLREFLRYGVEEATGDGAVRIRPEGVTAEGAVRVRLDLLGEAKPYTVHMSADVICDFLDETERVVPTGAEADENVMDALIKRLLEY